MKASVIDAPFLALKNIVWFINAQFMFTYSNCVLEKISIEFCFNIFVIESVVYWQLSITGVAQGRQM